MAELELKSTDDLKKLKGWTVQRAFKAGDRVMAIALVLSHPAAEKKIMVIIDATVKMGRSGQVVVAQEKLEISVKDVIEPQGE